MTPNMSLKKWNDLGQLSREMWYYRELCHKADMNLIIYSYGRNDQLFLKDFPEAQVLCMHSWIPAEIPFRLQNLIYNIVSLFIYRKYFKKVTLSKTNQFTASKFGLLLKLFHKTPLVIRMGFYHSHFKKISLYKRILEKISFRLCDLILTTSAEAAEFIIGTYKVSPEKILSICNSIDLNKFRPLHTLKEYDILFVGRLEKVKNIELMMLVINSVKLKTLIIGKGSLGPLVKKSMESNPMIEWRERVDNIDLPEYYNKSKCFLILSKYEGNPKALLEAMACGIPGIGALVPGIRECIQTNFSGILVNTNQEDIASQILELCSNNDKAVFLGHNAFAWVQNQGDYVKNIGREVGLYSKLLKHN